MQKPLVTILVPVFNGEKFFSKLLDSILKQDYKNIQVIIVNDGSTDNTDNLIKSYFRKFEESKIKFNYIIQENKGQSYAIKEGLKYVEGDFLTWPDSDDYYLDNDVISKMLDTMLKHNINIVRCKPFHFNEKKMYKKVYISKSKNLFFDCLFAENNFWFQPICYMINFNKYKEINPNLSFYCEKSAGQNWQIYLPMLKNNDCFTIDEYCCAVYERVDSHSRKLHKRTELIEKKYNSYINTIESTLNNMDLSSNEKNKYIEYIKCQYLKKTYKELMMINRQKAKKFRSENKKFITLSLFEKIKILLIVIGIKNIIKY